VSDRDRGDEPSLFDLPLVPEEAEPRRREPPRPAAGPARRPPAAPSPERPLLPFDDAAAESRRTEGGPDTGWEGPGEESPPWEREEGAAPGAAGPVRAPFGARLVAVAVDAAALAAVGGVGMLGMVLLGVELGGRALPGLGAFLLVFSFAYSVIPLAFWGATPGMAAAGLVARGADGGGLTFGQTGLRWLAGLATLALAGLPLLLALGGRSPADHLSGSSTWLA
jgi:uncharacterized RDD family membrane protein YckC